MFDGFVAVVRLGNVVPFLQYRRLRFIFGAQRANTNLGTEVNNWYATESNKKKKKIRLVLVLNPFPVERSTH